MYVKRSLLSEGFIILGLEKNLLLLLQCYLIYDIICFPIYVHIANFIEKNETARHFNTLNFRELDQIKNDFLFWRFLRGYFEFFSGIFRSDFQINMIA